MSNTNHNKDKGSAAAAKSGVDFGGLDSRVLDAPMSPKRRCELVFQNGKFIICRSIDRDVCKNLDYI
jgi:hypothetical protein